MMQRSFIIELGASASVLRTSAELDGAAVRRRSSSAQDRRSRLLGGRGGAAPSGTPAPALARDAVDGVPA